MKRIRRKIGQRQEKSFPVVQVQFRPADFGETVTICSLNPCHSSHAQALFLVRIFINPEQIKDIMQQFPQQQVESLAWEKAYRSQLRNEAEPQGGYPICAPCVTSHIVHFLGEEREQEAAIALVTSITTGKDIILFDRNLSRDKIYPALALGFFPTLQDFRKQYYEEAGD